MPFIIALSQNFTNLIPPLSRKWVENYKINRTLPQIRVIVTIATDPDAHIPIDSNSLAASERNEITLSYESGVSYIWKKGYLPVDLSVIPAVPDSGFFSGFFPV